MGNPLLLGRSGVYNSFFWLNQNIQHPFKPTMNFKFNIFSHHVLDPSQVYWWDWCAEALNKHKYSKRKQSAADTDALLDQFKGLLGREVNDFLEEWGMDLVTEPASPSPM